LQDWNYARHLSSSVKLAGFDKFEKYEFGFGQNVTECSWKDM
jgi:hypothetical protein